jgi:bis(5'-nucleosyl)-tetraphosphatase (symmetrical)
MHYLVGDLQGCDGAFGRLLATVGFSPSRDSLTLLGDLVNRGPSSLAVLRRVRDLGAAATAVLGNHDLHVLAVSLGARPAQPRDTLQGVLEAPDRQALLAWLRAQPLATQAHGWLCVHAGVAPSWSAAQTLALASEASALLQSADGDDLLRSMYGNQPARWQDDLHGTPRWRAIVNVLTRMRFCRDDGTMDFDTKEGAHAAPAGFMPWFDVPLRATAGTRMAFGHWSTLGLMQRDSLLALDTGCVWGGALTAARVDGGRCEVVQVPCIGDNAT